jgi:hypothetical protein
MVPITSLAMQQSMVPKAPERFGLCPEDVCFC